MSRCARGCARESRTRRGAGAWAYWGLGARDAPGGGGVAGVLQPGRESVWCAAGHGTEECLVYEGRDEACPVSTRGGTRLVQLVREGGGGRDRWRRCAKRGSLGESSSRDAMPPHVTRESSSCRSASTGFPLYATKSARRGSGANMKPRPSSMCPAVSGSAALTNPRAAAPAACSPHHQR